MRRINNRQLLILVSFLAVIATQAEQAPISTTSSLPTISGLKWAGEGGCINSYWIFSTIRREGRIGGEFRVTYTKVSAEAGAPGLLKAPPNGIRCTANDGMYSELWNQSIVGGILQHQERIVDERSSTADEFRALEAVWYDDYGRHIANRVVEGFNPDRLIRGESDLYQSEYRKFETTLRKIVSNESCTKIESSQGIRILRDEYSLTHNPSIKRIIVEVLARAGNYASFAIESEHSKVRMAYVMAIGREGRCEPYADIVRALYDPDQKTVEWALHGIRNCWNSSNKALTIQALESMIQSYRNGRDDAVFGTAEPVNEFETLAMRIYCSPSRLGASDRGRSSGLTVWATS